MISALSIGEIMTVGSLTTLIGILITFFTLLLLVFILNMMKRINVKNNIAEEADKAPAVTVQQTFRQDDSIIAAITAAITIVLTQESAANKAKASFVVKSIKRI